MSVWSEYNIVARRKLVWEAAVAVRCCAVGGTAILRTSTWVTMFATGILWGLQACFERMTIVRPFTTCAASPESFVVLSGRLPDMPFLQAEIDIVTADEYAVKGTVYDFFRQV